MAFYEQDPKTGAVQQFQGNVPDEAMQVMESMDDKQIMEGMLGVGSDVLFYRFPIKSGGGSKEVIGISVEGGYELANGVRNLQAMNDWKVDKDSDPDYAYVVIRVLNLANNNILLGVGRQCKFVVGPGNIPDHSRTDEHWFVKAFSKAQRNGILHHADQRMLATLIETWSKGGKGRLLAPPVSTESARPAIPAQQTRPAAQPAPKTAPVQPPATVTHAATPTPASVIPSSVPAPAPAAVVTSPEQQAIKDLEKQINQKRVAVHNKFANELGINADARKEIIKKTFATLDPVPQSLTDLSLNQLNQLLEVAENMIQAKSNGQVTSSATPTPPDVNPKAGLTPLGFDSVDEQTALRKALGDLLTNPALLGMSTEESRKFITDRGYAKSLDIPKDKILAMTQEAQDIFAKKTAPIDF